MKNNFYKLQFLFLIVLLYNNGISAQCMPDTVKPVVGCYHGLTVNMISEPAISVFAADFIKQISDNCDSPTDIVLALTNDVAADTFPLDSKGKPNTVVTFKCLTLGVQKIKLWAKDKAGNTGYCTTSILVYDPANYCMFDFIYASGIISTENGIPVKGVKLIPPIEIHPMLATFTDTAGWYDYTHFPVKPYKNDEWLSGVTTYDLTLISRHILGLEPFSSPYKIIAADANNSGSVTSFDIVELRKLILGVYPDIIPNGISWRFVDKKFVFPYPKNPFKSGYPDTITFYQHWLPEDFIAIKTGDVNGSFLPNNAPNRSGSPLYLQTADRSIATGDILDLHFTVDPRALAAQFTLETPGFEIQNIQALENATAENFALFDDRRLLTASLDGPAAFTLRVKALADGPVSRLLRLSDAVTPALAYNRDEQESALALQFTGRTVPTGSGLSATVYPNPWKEQTQLTFYLPSAGSLRVRLVDQLGRLVYEQNGYYEAGWNTLELSRSEAGMSGVLFCVLETETERQTIKLITGN